MKKTMVIGIVSCLTYNDGYGAEESSDSNYVIHGDQIIRGAANSDQTEPVPIGYVDRSELKTDYDRGMFYRMTSLTNEVEKTVPPKTTARRITMPEGGISYAAEKEKSGFELFYSRAMAGDGRAMDVVGCLYEKGKGVAKNLDLAKMWYEKAISSGNDASKKSLGRLCELMSDEKLLSPHDIVEQARRNPEFIGRLDYADHRYDKARGQFYTIDSFVSPQDPFLSEIDKIENMIITHHFSLQKAKNHLEAQAIRDAEENHNEIEMQTHEVDESNEDQRVLKGKRPNPFLKVTLDAPLLDFFHEEIKTDEDGQKYIGVSMQELIQRGYAFTPQNDPTNVGEEGIVYNLQEKEGK